MGQTLMEMDEIGARRANGHAGGRPQKWVLTDQGRDLILRNYDGTTERIDMLVARLGVPRTIVKRWACQLVLYG